MVDQDEFKEMSSKTWSRAVESISKNGYLEGASAGREASFQNSFDRGYMEGFKYGMTHGINTALKRSHTNSEADIVSINDSQKSNCQICIDGNLINQGVDNICNVQSESNKMKIKELHVTVSEVLSQIGVDRDIFSNIGASNDKL